MAKDAPVGAETALPMSKEIRLSMDSISSSLDMSDVRQEWRKLLASSRACKKFGG